MRSWIFMTLLIWICPASASQETHGGNGFIAEFFSIYDRLIQPSTRFCYEILPRSGAEYNELVSLRTRLEVQSQPTVSLDGRFVDAINQPGRKPKLVVLSEERWKRANEEQKQALVLHELIHLLGYRDESPSYKHSSPVLNCMKNPAHPNGARDQMEAVDMCELMKALILEENPNAGLSGEDEDSLINFCGPGWEDAI